MISEKEIAQEEEQHPLICQCCGVNREEDDEVTELEPGLVLCYSCEVENYAYCTVCERYMHQYSAHAHRHLFETVHGEWYGTGGMDMGANEYEEVRLSLFALLDRMGRRFAKDLARTIKNGHMCYDRLHTVTGIVLGPITIFCHLDGGWMRQYKCYARHSYGEKLHTLFDAYEYGEDEDEAPFLYGFWWLFGLGNDTPEDNTRTCEWIAQWQMITRYVREHCA